MRYNNITLLPKHRIVLISFTFTLSKVLFLQEIFYSITYRNNITSILIRVKGTESSGFTVCLSQSFPAVSPAPTHTYCLPKDFAFFKIYFL